MKRPFIVRISRPRLWLYLLGPFLIGIAAAEPSKAYIPYLLLTGLYFTFPANFLIYGTNDIFDYETDKRSSEKQSYEVLVGPEKQQLVGRIIFGVLVLTILIMPLLPFTARLSLVGFIFLSVFYSSPPIRAKTKPLLDSVFNSLYIFPALVGYGQITNQLPPVQLILAGTLLCMATHAYSAVPHILIDRKAHIQTTATWLGARNTILFCLTCYLLSAILTYPWLDFFSVVLGALFSGMMIATLISLNNKKRILELYKRIPLINTVAGACLLLWIVLL